MTSALPAAPEIRDCGDVAVARLPLAGRSVDLLALAAQVPERYPFLLESSAGAAAQSRYDVLPALPQQAIEVSTADPAACDFLQTLDRAHAAATAPNATGLPFIGGWFVYLGYELAARIDPALTLPAPDTTLPLALAVRCPAAIIRDRARDCLYLLAEDNDHACVRSLCTDLSACWDTPLNAAPVPARMHEQPAQRYLEQVAAARAQIQAGALEQANLARSWHGELLQPTDPTRLYAALRAANPAPFSGLMRWRRAAVLSSSPERLLALDGAGRVRTRPIAGTRPRTAASAAAASRALLAHPKERHEHATLVAQQRRDLAGVCLLHTTAVAESMVVESYAHVHHIVSGICGRLRPDVGPGAALRAVFPAASITGSPKRPCMDFIARQEGAPRGAYTGSFGYLSRCGRMDVNILIRSITQCDRQLTVQAGAGIVAASDPQRELQETRVKAQGVLRALAAGS